MTSPTTTTKRTQDRFKPFRRGMYGLYMVVVSLVSVRVAVDVVRSVLDMTPAVHPDSPTPKPVMECVMGMQRMWNELECQRIAITSNSETQQADQIRVSFLSANAQAMKDALECQRMAVPPNAEAQQADHLWVSFRKEWIRRLRGVQSECAIHAPGREGLKRLSTQLENVMDLYTTHAVQYSGEIGPAVDSLRASLRQEQKQP